MRLDSSVRQVLLSSLPRRMRGEIERELAGHLEDCRHHLEGTGLSAEEATRESLARLGDPFEIADGFARVYRPRIWSRLALAFALAGTLVAGAYSSGAFASPATRHHQPAQHHARATPAPRISDR